MSREVNKHEQLTFDFDKEYPSLLEPLQKKEKELGKKCKMNYNEK